MVRAGSARSTSVTKRQRSGKTKVHRRKLNSGRLKSFAFDRPH